MQTSFCFVCDGSDLFECHIEERGDCEQRLDCSMFLGPECVWGCRQRRRRPPRGTNLVDVESERVKEVVPKAGSMELIGHEDHADAAASGAASSQLCTFL